MHRHMLIGAAASLALSGATAVAAEFSARYSGFQELGALNNETGAILSDGKGTLFLDLDKSARTLSFELTYSGLSSPVTQSHIHFAKVHVPGGIIVFFCSNLAGAPTGTQPCPANGGTVHGTITAGNVLAIAGQNITAGDFDALADVLTSDSAYGNIHTTKFPAGEIRGQIHSRDKHDDGD
jgi:hypothetical protein